jgi:hypothetical protein
MMAEGKIEPYLIYPPGFHEMTATICRLTGLPPLEVFPVVAPLLLLLPALALYALARRVWGWGYGVVAALFSVLLGGTYYYYNDAMYPNLVTSQFVMVLAVATLVVLYASPSIRTGLLLALLGSSVVLYHPVASMYVAALLAVVGIAFVPYLLLRDRRTGLTLLFSLAVLGLLSTLYAWDTYDLPGAVAGLVSDSGTSSTRTAVTMAIGTQTPYTLDFLLGNMVSQPVAWLGVLGAFLVAGDLLRGGLGTPQRLAYLTLLVWALLLFIGSRTSLSGFPQRFERDLGIPLAVLAALSLVTILGPLLPRGPGASLATRLVAVPVAALALAVVGLQVAENLGNAAAPSRNVISAEVAAAGEWLEDNHAGGNIVVTPYLNDHVPGSAMLAMGGYTGLRSYTEKRLRSPRALPPSGKESLLAARWVTHHPVGERTGSILDTYDIRDVTLFKRSPSVPWRSFEDRPGLYRKVFENESVVIFAPSGIVSPSGA